MNKAVLIILVTAVGLAAGACSPQPAALPPSSTPQPPTATQTATATWTEIPATATATATATFTSTPTRTATRTRTPTFTATPELKPREGTWAAKTQNGVFNFEVYLEGEKTFIQLMRSQIVVSCGVSTRLTFTQFDGVEIIDGRFAIGKIIEGEVKSAEEIAMTVFIKIPKCPSTIHTSAFYQP